MLYAPFMFFLMYNGMQDFACMKILELDFAIFGSAEVARSRFWAASRFWNSRPANFMWKLPARPANLLASCTSFRAGHRGCPEFATLRVGGRQLWLRAADFGAIFGPNSIAELTTGSRLQRRHTH